MTKEKTLPLTVANTGFLLDRLGEDCHPLQFLRELTKNGIEAILRTEKKTGEVIWDVDWPAYDETGIYKLSITDNGDGMTGQDMEKYINQLSSSASEQSFIGNYGVGAKISAATRNHEGLIYLSWKQGIGNMAHLWREPSTGQYGLRQLQKPNGEFDHYAEISDHIKPDLIDQHGTKVILLGNHPEQDTMAAPIGSPSPSRWVVKYLNTRFFKIPEGIKIKVREGWTNPLLDRDRNLLRTVTGQAAYLNEHAESTGIVSLTGAIAHWWILKDERALSSNSGYIESAGHVAALYKDEIYELANGRSGMAHLQHFGVVFGYKRVVIYIEPVASDYSLTTNTARTRLMIDSKDLPWSEWASEFRNKLPTEIEKLIHDIASNSSSNNHKDSIRDRLKNIIDLYRISKYRMTPKGKIETDPDSKIVGGDPKKLTESKQKNSANSGGQGGRAGGIYTNYLKDNGQKSENVSPDNFPEVQWVSIEDNTRESGIIEDRAARYLQEQNLLQINKDFRAFTDMTNRFLEEYKGNVALKSIIEDTVHQWFEQTLVETVMGVQSLIGSQEWDISTISQALSEEALTASVMPRYHVHVAIKRELGAKIGTTKG
ncbi:ATP-binding protein [Deinococcus sp. 14RED07]|uniref:ATP-binding protein n=1 Tax=Deinococcus sp. 14RED07 TaxID=2745874 RepID=UPI001E4E08AD|nr:ATP-binding protein [Deinococcus sp. 14RED07]MCD0175644.1 ATP-binding protein [Deinococcus sp. 14RED07]